MIPAKFEMLESFLATKSRSYIHLADMMVTQRFLPKKINEANFTRNATYASII